MVTDRHDDPTSRGRSTVTGDAAPATSRARYSSSPFVCGAIGAWDERVLARLARNAPERMEPVIQSAFLVLLSSGPTTTWRSPDFVGHCWGILAHGSSPSQWADASERWMATGAAIGEAVAAVHTDALAFQDLYHRRIADAVYFAVRIDPLVDLDDAKLHIDWSAWASLLAVTSPVGDHTPFAEIRRLPAATALVCRGAHVSLESFEPSWLAADSDARLGPADVIDVLQTAIRPTERTRITLSGGWDSRLLAILAARRVRSVTAYTTSHDDGYDLDVEFARPVAAALDIEQQEIIPDDHAWVREYTAVRTRTEFQTVHHTWFMPLYRHLHRGSSPVLDGLAGDVLFKNLFVTPEVLTEDDPEQRWQRVWASLGGAGVPRDTLLQPRLRDELIAMSKESFRTATDSVTHHRAGATLAILATRTARAIASSPLLLLAPEVPVELPFADPRVMGAALRIPVEVKADGRFYQRMLETADPVVAGLPSTNTVKPNGPRGPRRLMRTESLNALVSHIRTSELVNGMLQPDLREALLDPPIDLRRYRTLTWASIFGQWLAEYESNLVVEGLS